MSLLNDLEFKLHQYMSDVHALEKHVLRQLELHIPTTKEEQLQAALIRHRDETEQQIARLNERFVAHNERPSSVKSAGAQFAAFFESLAAVLHDDKPAKTARDAYVTEHLEIAAYELLERLALRAGDPETARVARQNRAEEEAMAATIAADWDPVMDRTLAEQGLLAQVPGR
jgi:ferritin-like metal-binding protein YciE